MGDHADDCLDSSLFDDESIYDDYNDFAGYYFRFHRTASRPHVLDYEGINSQEP
jgi:hypothetical protein